MIAAADRILARLNDAFAPSPPVPPLSPGRPFPGSAGVGDAADLSALAGALARQGRAVALFELDYQAVRAVSVVRTGSGVSRSEHLSETVDLRLTVAGDPGAARQLMDRIAAAFTPEKVAARIAGFVLKGPAGTRDDAGQAVERGYAQALGLLGPLQADVKATLEETMRRVRELLDAPGSLQPDVPWADTSLSQS